MQFASPGSIAFSIFGLDIFYYGIFMGIAICTSLYLSNYISEKYYDLKNIVINISPVLLLYGILGARLYYCLLNFGYYAHNPIEILAIRNGGLSIHGALLGGIIALIVQSRHYKIPFLKLSDIIVSALPLGQAIARWGNFFNSEAFGLPCDLPWKIYIPIQNRPLDYINCDFFHPTFLYESILDVGIFFVLIALVKKKTNIGIVTAIYLILYSIVRILVETLRIDAIVKIYGIPFPTIVSVLTMIAGIILYKYCLSKNK